MKNAQTTTDAQLALNSVVSGCANFDRRNTKVGSIKWTRTFFRGKRRTVKVIIDRLGQLANGENTFHGMIKATRERLVIYKYGADGRFWGTCYHTKEAADEYGW